MKITDVCGFSKDRLETTRACSECGWKVVEGAAPNVYCPKCGHKFVQRPRLVDSDKVARLLEEHLKKKEGV